ncbi:MAG: hypothetical protein IPN87_10410 [Saprospiraceae bacterium]|nr:hypothetical protein [Candidatus Brachybacter algidus]
MFLHVSINFKKEVLMSVGLKSYPVLSFDPLTQFIGKLLLLSNYRYSLIGVVFDASQIPLCSQKFNISKEI